MKTALDVLEPGRLPRQSVAPLRPGLSILARIRDVLLEWLERDALRARLGGLSDQELLDIGIARGEIDYVASNRATDPRGAVTSP
jgi:uncharacterized protein YjiS (DUF1127 family)